MAALYQDYLEAKIYAMKRQKLLKAFMKGCFHSCGNVPLILLKLALVVTCFPQYTCCYAAADFFVVVVN